MSYRGVEYSIVIENTDEETALCHNPLCDTEECPSEMIGHQCDCGGYIWHKDEYTEDPEVTQ